MRSRLFAGLTAASLGLCLASAAMAAAPDKNGITWDDPKASVPPSSAPAPAAPPPILLTPPPPVQSSAPAAVAAGASPANLDNADIIWNAPPTNPGATPGAVPAPRTTATAALNTNGPCHEFQTTIVIDGRKQPAHGTVCRQADGSWHIVDK